MTVPATEPAVLARTEGAVHVITLNRPGSANALSPDIVEGLSGALRKVGSDQSVHVVVLTGMGRSFCAGLDLKHLLTLSASDRRSYLAKVVGLFRMVWRLPQPVIAALNGHAVAGGFDLSVFCDLRYASEEALFAQTEILIGLNAISTPRHHVIGLGHARELAYLGEKIPASEAHRIGLVNQVFSTSTVLDEALKVAHKMALRPRRALLDTKRLTREMLDAKVDGALDAAGESILDGLNVPAQRQQLQLYVDAMSSKPRNVVR